MGVPLILRGSAFVSYPTFYQQRSPVPSCVTLSFTLCEVHARPYLTGWGGGSWGSSVARPHSRAPSDDFCFHLLICKLGKSS